MCQYLDWELTAHPVTPKEFEEMVHKDFVNPDPYSTHSSINEEVGPSRLFI